MNRQEKAKALRYKKSVVDGLNISDIASNAYDIQSICNEYQYAFESGDETLLNALDGDEEQEYEFKMMFSDLSCECDEFVERLDTEYITDYFDTLVSAIRPKNRDCFGYDAYEGDFFALSDCESESAKEESRKRLERLTKSQLIEATQEALQIIIDYYDLISKFDYLKAAFDVLKDDNTSFLKIIKEINDTYNKASEEDFRSYAKNTVEFNKLLNNFDEYSRIWVE